MCKAKIFKLFFNWQKTSQMKALNGTSKLKQGLALMFNVSMLPFFSNEKLIPKLEFTEQCQSGNVAKRIKTKTKNTNKMKCCQTKSYYFI